MNIYLSTLLLTDFLNGKTVSLPLRGLEGPSLSPSTFPRSGEDGIEVASIYTRERRIIIEGALQANCEDDLILLRRQLSSLCLPSRNTNDGIQSTVLRIVTDDGGDYTIPVFVMGLYMPIVSTSYSKYQIDLLAEDYRIYATTSTSATVTKSIGGGLSLPFSLPFSFVGGVDGSASVTNSGDIATYPTIRFNGPLTNPRLYNDENGLFIQLNTTIDTGDYIIIDTLKKTVLENGSVNKLSTMTANSRWLYISPGENTLSLTSGSSGDTGTAVISFSDAYSAI